VQSKLTHILKGSFLWIPWQISGSDTIGNITSCALSREIIVLVIVYSAWRESLVHPLCCLLCSPKCCSGSTMVGCQYLSSFLNARPDRVVFSCFCFVGRVSVWNSTSDELCSISEPLSRSNSEISDLDLPILQPPWCCHGVTIRSLIYS